MPKEKVMQQPNLVAMALKATHAFSFNFHTLARSASAEEIRRIAHALLDLAGKNA